MTKPIEGWVAWHPWSNGFNRDNTCEVHRLIQGAEHELRRESNNKNLIADLWQVRPVKITFTDEPSTEVVDEIRKDRERIYLELQPHIGEDSYFETDDGDREYSVPSDRCLRGIIFGEEK